MFFFIIVFFLMAIFKISLRDIWTAISSLKLWQFVLLLFIFLLISLFHIFTRKYLLYSLYSSATFKNLTLIHFSSMAAHYSTPAKIGFPLAVYLLNRLDNVPYATGTTVILIELIVSTTICGIIAFIGALFYLTGKTNIFIFSFSCLLIFVVLTFYGMHIFLKKGNENSRIYQFIKKVREAFSHIAVSHLMIYMCLMIFIQLLAGITLVLLSGFLSGELSLWQAIIANSTAFFLGAISMIPMGLGVREGSLLFYLRHLGITNEVGISIVTIQRLFSTGLSFVLGVIFGAILGVKNISQDST
ncbi:MAG: flippase-like domain-containing protein [Deltaproteobacteria bacterium]|nr:MAG: flippase-like domain-containing protein [Deltaproteobacteria bacterium]